MIHSRKASAVGKKSLLAALICLSLPLSLKAQTDDAGPASQDQGPETSSHFEIKTKKQFVCAEVDEVTAGGLATHEITLDPRRVQRCLLKKVGSRYHECKKLKIEDSTADWYGVVTLDTKDGPVQFKFEDVGENSSEAKRVMVWTWPDTDEKYVCAMFTGRR